MRVYRDAEIKVSDKKRIICRLYRLLYNKLCFFVYF